jgi:hypothetical protein
VPRRQGDAGELRRLGGIAALQLGLALGGASRKLRGDGRLAASTLWFLPMFREIVQACLGIVRDVFRVRANLIAENTLLRQQLVVLKRSTAAR